MSSAPAVTPVVQFRPEQLQLSRGVPLGSGAMSHVVQCRLRSAANPALPVVVKIVSKVQVLQQGKVQNIMNEKAALQRLGPHPYVARLYGTSQSEDELYYVLEWLPHGDLLQHIRRAHLARVRAYTAAAAAASGPTESSPSSSPSSGGGSKRSLVAAIPASSTALRCLDFHDVQLITAQLVLALSQLAAKGVVLRDLKPENVAFDEKYRACLLDFDTVDLEGCKAVPESNHGVACPPPCTDAPTAAPAAAGDASATATANAASGQAPPSAPPRRRLTVSEIQGMRKKSASFCGTAQYVSPEMVGECKWSFSSDLWALGALVYEMVYGVHLFAGMSQFEVLQKVIQGDYLTSNALFPVIDFDAGAAGAAAGSGSGEAGTDRFAVFKDFVRQLLNIDPSKRLGVNSETHAFDAAALRAHPFFDGVEWPALEEQLGTFRARIFPATGPKDASAPLSRVRHASAFDAANAELDEQSDDSSTEGPESDTAAAVAAEREALKALVEASVDPSPSLAHFYHTLPYNDPSYADYVYRATADANPFEKFFVKAGGGAVGDEGAGAPEAAAAGDSEPHDVNGQSAAQKSGACKRVSDVDDVEDDVIDDVGMHYLGSHPHPDFQRESDSGDDE